MLDWPDWTQTPTTSFVQQASSDILNAVQMSVEDALHTVSAATRKLGPTYGPFRIGGRVDIVAEEGLYLYIRALVCIGEIEQISSVRINNSSYLTGDPTGDPDYQFDWDDGSAWTAAGGFPYAASAGEIWLYSGSYHECTTDVSITSNLGSYTPTGVYSAYFSALITNAEVNTYTGTTTQTVDPLLAAAGGSLSGYAETLTGTWGGEDYGIAYVVLKLLRSSYTGGFPRVSVSGQGLKVYDPRTSLTAYSTTPALALYDALTSRFYGLGATVDATSTGTVADYNEDAFTDGDRIEIGMAYAPDRPELTTALIDVLRTYAMCWLTIRDGIYYMVADAPAGSSGNIAFDQAAGIEPELMTLPSIESTPIDDIPNRVRVYWTDGASTSAVEVETAAVTAGTEIEREEEIRMPGLFREEMAQRWADYRLAAQNADIWRTSFSLDDAGEAVHVGDVWSITSPTGFSAVHMRIVSRSAGGLGEYEITGQPYDATIYQSP